LCRVCLATSPVPPSASSTLLRASSSYDAATARIYTLSLHDALPIFPIKVDTPRDSALLAASNFDFIPPVPNLEPHHSLLQGLHLDRKSTRLNSSHVSISYAVFCLKKKKNAGRQRQSAVRGSSYAGGK